MTTPGDYGSEMERFQKLSDREVEDLLAGKVPIGDGDLGDLAELLDGVKAAVVRSPDPDVTQRHLADIMEAARLAPEGSRDSAPSRIKARRRTMIGALLAPLWAKIATAAAVAVAATTGLAVADQLPQPAQDAMANVAERVGLNFPSSEDEEVTASLEEEEGEEDGEGRPESPGKSVAEDVHAVLEDDSLEGRDKGEAVSTAASQNRQNADRNPTGFGPDNHPTGPPEGVGGDDGEDEAEEGSSNNPTGYGKDNNPGRQP